MDTGNPASLKFTAEKYKKTRLKKSSYAKNVAKLNDKMKSKDEEIINEAYVYVWDSYPEEENCLKGRIVRSSKMPEHSRCIVDEFGDRTDCVDRVETGRFSNQPWNKGDESNVETTKSGEIVSSGVNQHLTADTLTRTSTDISTSLELKCQFCCEMFTRQADLEYHYFHHFTSYDELNAFLNQLRSNSGKKLESHTAGQSVGSSCESEKGQNDSVLNIKQSVGTHETSPEKNNRRSARLSKQQEELVVEADTEHTDDDNAANCTSELRIDADNTKRTSCSGADVLDKTLNSKSKDNDQNIAIVKKTEVIEEKGGGFQLENDFVVGHETKSRGLKTVICHSCSSNMCICDNEEQCISNKDEKKLHTTVANKNSTKFVDTPEETVVGKCKSRRNCNKQSRGLDKDLSTNQMSSGIDNTPSEAATRTETALDEPTLTETGKTESEVSFCPTYNRGKLKTCSMNKNVLKQISSAYVTKTKELLKKSLSDVSGILGLTGGNEVARVETNNRIKRKTDIDSNHDLDGKLSKQEAQHFDNTLILKSSHCEIENDEPKWIIQNKESKIPRTPLSLKKLRYSLKRKEDSIPDVSIKSRQSAETTNDRSNYCQKSRKCFRKRNSRSKQGLDVSTDRKLKKNLKSSERGSATNSVELNLNCDTEAGQNNARLVSCCNNSEAHVKRHERQIEVQSKLLNMKQKQQDKRPSNGLVGNFGNYTDTLDSGFGSAPCVADELSRPSTKCLTDDSSSSYCSSIIDDGDSITLSFLEENDTSNCGNDNKIGEENINTEVTQASGLTNKCSDSDILYDFKNDNTTNIRGMLILDELDLSEHSDSSATSENSGLNRQKEEKTLLDSCLDLSSKESKSTKVGDKQASDSRKEEERHTEDAELCNKVSNENNLSENSIEEKHTKHINQVKDDCSMTEEIKQLSVSDKKSSLLRGRKKMNLTKGVSSKKICDINNTGDNKLKEKMKMKFESPTSISEQLEKNSIVYNTCKTVSSVLMNNNSGSLFYTCERCSRRYKSVVGLHQHWLDNEHYNLTLEPITYNLYTCMFCFKKFMTKVMMNIHSETCSDGSKELITASIQNKSKIPEGQIENVQCDTSKIYQDENEAQSKMTNSSTVNKNDEKQGASLHIDLKQKLVLHLRKMEMANFNSNGLKYEFIGSSKRPSWKVVEEKKECAVVDSENLEIGGAVEVNMPDSSDNVNRVEDLVLDNDDNETDLNELNSNFSVCHLKMTEEMSEDESENDSGDNLERLKGGVNMSDKSKFVSKKNICERTTTYLTEFEKALIKNNLRLNHKKTKRCRKKIDRFNHKKVKRHNYVQMQKQKVDLWIIPKPGRGCKSGSFETMKHFNASKTAQKIYCEDQKRKNVGNELPDFNMASSLYNMPTHFTGPQSLAVAKTCQPFTDSLLDSPAYERSQDFGKSAYLHGNQGYDSRGGNQTLSVKNLKRNLESALGLKGIQERSMLTPSYPVAAASSPPCKKQKELDADTNNKLPSFSESFSRCGWKRLDFKQYESSYSAVGLDKMSAESSNGDMASLGARTSLSYCNNLFKVSFNAFHSEATSYVNSNGSSVVHWAPPPKCFPSSVTSSTSQTSRYEEFSFGQGENTSCIQFNIPPSTYSTVDSVLNGLDPNYSSELGQRQKDAIGLYQPSHEFTSTSDMIGIARCTLDDDSPASYLQTDSPNMEQYSVEMSDNNMGNRSINEEVDFLDPESFQGCLSSEKDFFNMVVNDDGSCLLGDITEMSSHDSLDKGNEYPKKISGPVSDVTALGSTVIQIHTSDEASFEKSEEVTDKEPIEDEYFEIPAQDLIGTPSKKTMQVSMVTEDANEVIAPDMKAIFEEGLVAENQVNKIQCDTCSADTISMDNKMMNASNDTVLDDKTGLVVYRDRRKINILDSGDLKKLDVCDSSNNSFKDENFRLANEMVDRLENWVKENTCIMGSNSCDGNAEETTIGEVKEQKNNDVSLETMEREYRNVVHDENNNVELHDKYKDLSLIEDSLSDLREHGNSDEYESNSQVSCNEDGTEKSDLSLNLPEIKNESVDENDHDVDDFEYEDIEKDINSDCDTEVEGSIVKEKDTSSDCDTEVESSIISSAEMSFNQHEVSSESFDEGKSTDSLNKEEVHVDSMIVNQELDDMDDVISLCVSDEEAAFLISDNEWSNDAFHDKKSTSESPSGSEKLCLINENVNAKTDDSAFKETSVAFNVPDENSENGVMKVKCEDFVPRHLQTNTGTAQTNIPKLLKVDVVSLKTCPNSLQMKTCLEKTSLNIPKMDMCSLKTCSNSSQMKTCLEKTSLNIPKMDKCSLKTCSNSSQMNNCLQKTVLNVPQITMCSQKSSLNVPQTDMCSQKTDLNFPHKDMCSQKSGLKFSKRDMKSQKTGLNVPIMDMCSQRIVPNVQQMDMCSQNMDMGSQKMDMCSQKMNMCSQRIVPNAQQMDMCSQKMDMCSQRIVPNAQQMDMCSQRIVPNAQQMDMCSQKTAWVPKGYCYRMFYYGNCDGPCNYKHTLPSDADLQKSIPYVVECVTGGDVDRAMNILDNHIYYQQYLSPEVLNTLFDLCCSNCKQVHCQKLLYLFLDRGLINRGHIDCVIFLWKQSENVEDLTPLQNALTIAIRANILPQADAIQILLQTFAESDSMFCLWDTIVFCCSLAFPVPVQYTSYGLTAAINSTDMLVLHKVVFWLKNADRLMLESVDDELLKKLQNNLEEMSEYEAASTIQYLLESKHYEFIATTSAPRRSRSTTPLQLSNPQGHAVSARSKQFAHFPYNTKSLTCNQPMTPMVGRGVRFTKPSVVSRKTAEMMTNMPPTEDQRSFVKLIENASNANDLRHLARLFINRSASHCPIEPCIIKRFLIVLGKDKKTMGENWRHFIDIVSTMYCQKLSKNSSSTLDKAGLSFIASDLLCRAYNLELWSQASVVLLTIVSLDLLELSPIVEQQRGVSLIPLAIDTFINNKLPEKAAEIVQVYASRQLRIDVKTEMMSMFVVLTKELCDRKMHSEAYQLVLTAFMWNYQGVHELSSLLIDSCLRAKNLEIPVKIFNQFLSRNIPFSVLPNVKRFMMNSLLAKKQWLMVADKLFSDIKCNHVLYTPQSYIKPRRIVLSTKYTSHEMCLVIRDYLQGLYSYFCDVLAMKLKLTHQDLNLTVVLISEVDMSGDSMLLLMGETPVSLLLVKNIFLREFGLHPVSLGNRSEFVLQAASLEMYLKDLDQKSHNVGIEFISSQRYR